MPTVLDAINAGASKPAMTPTQYLKTSPILNATPDPVKTPFYTWGTGPGVNTQPTQNYSEPPYDPYAEARAAEERQKVENQRIAQNNYQSGYDTMKTSQDSTINKWGLNYDTGWKSLYNQIMKGQESVDSQRVKNELGVKQGEQGVLGMVSRGTKSAGVMLGNRNAGSSSAVDRIARAYSQIGKGEMSKIGNQYALAEEDVNVIQKDLDRQETTGIESLNNSKELMLTDIVTETTNEVNRLTTLLKNADLPTQITIQAEIDAAKSKGLAKAKSVEDVWRNKVSSVNPASREASLTKAEQLMNSGTDMGKDMFNFTSEVPVGFNGPLPGGSNLPIYTIPRRPRI